MFERLLLLITSLCLFSVCYVYSIRMAESMVHRDHLVVICHGIMGNKNDLSYLAGKLESVGFHVLKSSSNEVSNSLAGVDIAAERLKDEIENEIQRHPDLRKISFVGNSLGGIFVRYVVRLLFDPETRKVAGLEPIRFLTIATPHLGVRHHTAIEEYSLFLPFAVKRAAAHTLRRSGAHIFGLDSDDLRSSLFYTMATNLEFLDPLRAFRERRLYVNVQLDFVVPLGTGAFLPKDQVRALRRKHRRNYGIVEVIPPTGLSTSSAVAQEEGDMGESRDEDEDEEEMMPEEVSPASSTRFRFFGSSGSSTSDKQSAASPSISASSSSSSRRTNGNVNIGSTSGSEKSVSKSKQRKAEELQCLEEMRLALDSLQWEKVLVRFSGVIPLAHNKIAALTKQWTMLDSMLGYPQGRFVMDHAFEWLSQSTDLTQVETDSGFATESDVLLEER